MYKKPRLTISKKDCICPETGLSIYKNQDCVYFPKEKKAYHPSSNKAQQYFKSKQS